MLNEPEGQRYISHPDGVIFLQRSEIRYIEQFRYLLNYNNLTSFKCYFNHLNLFAKVSYLRLNFHPVKNMTIKDFFSCILISDANFQASTTSNGRCQLIRHARKRSALSLITL